MEPEIQWDKNVTTGVNTRIEQILPTSANEPENMHGKSERIIHNRKEYKTLQGLLHIWMIDKEIYTSPMNKLANGRQKYSNM